jgi:hypothetical protein
MALINVKKNLFGRTPQTGNRMFLSDNTSPGTQTALSTIDATNGTILCSWFPFLGGIGGNKINTILPYKASAVTAETKLRIMFYQCADSTLFNELNAFYGTYVPNNYFQYGLPSTNTYVTNVGSTVNYNAANASASWYLPLPTTLIGYSAIITIAAGAGNQTIGHTQMFAADGSNGFFLPDGNIMMMVEIESTNIAVGTFGRIGKTPTTVAFDVLNCSPNWTNTVGAYTGYQVSKRALLNGGSFKSVPQGGMSSYTPPQTITTAELAAMFGPPTGEGNYLSGTSAAPLHTMITFT